MFCVCGVPARVWYGVDITPLEKQIVTGLVPQMSYLGGGCILNEQEWRAWKLPRKVFGRRKMTGPGNSLHMG